MKRLLSVTLCCLISTAMAFNSFAYTLTVPSEPYNPDGSNSFSVSSDADVSISVESENDYNLINGKGESFEDSIGYELKNGDTTITESTIINLTDGNEHSAEFSAKLDPADKPKNAGIYSDKLTFTAKTIRVGIPSITETSFTYDGTEKAPTITGLDDTKVEVSGDISATNVGNYNITFSLLDSSNYKWTDDSKTPKTVNWAIQKAAGSVTAPTAKPLTYNGEEQELVEAGSSTTGTIQYKLGADGTYSPNLPKAKNAGDYTVYYKVIGDDNHMDVAEKSVKASIVAKEAVLTWGTLTWAYDGNAHSTTCSVGNLEGSDTCTVTLSGNSITNVGSTTVTATGLSNSNYKLPTSTTNTLSITKADGSVTAPTAKTLTYNGENQTLINAGASATGTIQYKLETDGTYATSLPQAKAAGTYTVYYKVIGDDNHKDVDEASISVTIAKKTAELTWGTTSWTYNGNAHSTTCSVGNLEGSDTCTVTLSGNSITDVGSTTVTATGLSNSNYKLPSSTSKTITVTAASVGDKPTTAVSKTYNGSAQNNGYTKPAGVTMTGNNSGTNAGTYTATYTPDSNHTWSDGTRTAVTVTLTINKANGSVTAPTAKTLTYNGSNQTLINAGSSTTGTIQYKLGSSGTYGTSLPQAKDGGTYTIYYKVIGDDNHKDVAEASIKVNIKYLIEFDANGGTGAPSSTSKVPGTALTLSSTKPTLSGSQFVGWSTSSTGTTVNYAAGGSYTADANVKLYAVWFTPSISFAKSAS